MRSMVSSSCCCGGGSAGGASISYEGPLAATNTKPQAPIAQGSGNLHFIVGWFRLLRRDVVGLPPSGSILEGLVTDGGLGACPRSLASHQDASSSTS